MYFLLGRYLERDAALQNKKPAPPIEDEDRQQWTVRQFEALKQAYGNQDALSGISQQSQQMSLVDAPNDVKEYLEKAQQAGEKYGYSESKKPSQTPLVIPKQVEKTDVRKTDQQKLVNQTQSGNLPPKQIPKAVSAPIIKVPDLSRLDPKFLDEWERLRESDPNLPSLSELSSKTKTEAQATMSKERSDSLDVEKTVLPKRKNVPDALKDLITKQNQEKVRKF
jgi:hypothetical protein